MSTSDSDPRSQLNLPPGFRFFPTDEELMGQYLCKKVAGHHFPLTVIGDVDLYKHDPWDLPSKALFGETEWFFFSPRDRKYPNGSRPNRVAGSGYWKATGTDKAITAEGRKLGIKKALVFYVGKAPTGIKTNWIMHEYRLTEPPRKTGSSKLDEWVLCRIYKKRTSADSNDGVSGDRSKDSSPASDSHYDDVLESLPEIDGRLFPNSVRNLQLLGSGDFDWATVAGLSSLGPDVVQAQIGNAMGSGNGNDMYASTSFARNEFDHNYSGSVGPMGARYPAQGGAGFGFWQ